MTLCYIEKKDIHIYNFYFIKTNFTNFCLSVDGIRVQSFNKFQRIRIIFVNFIELFLPHFSIFCLISFLGLKYWECFLFTTLSYLWRKRIYGELLFLWAKRKKLFFKCRLYKNTFIDQKSSDFINTYKFFRTFFLLFSYFYSLAFSNWIHCVFEYIASNIDDEISKIFKVFVFFE